MKIFIPEGVIAGHLYTAVKRRLTFGLMQGGKKAMDLEKYQREMVRIGTGHDCVPTQVQIYMWFRRLTNKIFTRSLLVY